MIDQFKVSVYIDTGVVHEYVVSSPMKGREHAAAIISSGYRANDGNDLEWFPPHRILKVKVQNGADSTAYKDTRRST